MGGRQGEWKGGGPVQAGRMDDEGGEGDAAMKPQATTETATAWGACVTGGQRLWNASSKIQKKRVVPPSVTSNNFTEVGYSRPCE